MTFKFLFLPISTSSIIKLIRKTSRFGESYAEKQYNILLTVANATKVFCHSLPSDAALRLYISLLITYDNVADSVIKSIKVAVESEPDNLFAKQIRLLETIKCYYTNIAINIDCYPKS